MNKLMDAILIEKQNLADLEAEIEESKNRLAQLATRIKETNGSPSFKHGDKWYQIRKRGGRAFICEFDVEPGSWLKKND